jgi:hypothetical protein
MPSWIVKRGSQRNWVCAAVQSQGHKGVIDRTR